MHSSKLLRRAQGRVEVHDTRLHPAKAAQQCVSKGPPLLLRPPKAPILPPLRRPYVARVLLLRHSKHAPDREKSPQVSSRLLVSMPTRCRMMLRRSSELHEQYIRCTLCTADFRTMHERIRASPPQADDLDDQLRRSETVLIFCYLRASLPAVNSFASYILTYTASSSIACGCGAPVNRDINSASDP